MSKNNKRKLKEKITTFDKGYKKLRKIIEDTGKAKILTKMSIEKLKKELQFEFKRKEKIYELYLKLTKEELALRLILAEDKIEKIVLDFNSMIQSFEEIIKKNK